MVVEGILLVILRRDGPFLLMMAFPVGLPFLFASCLIATVAYFAASIASGYVSRRWVTAAVAASFIAVIGTLFAQSWWPRELPPRELHARVLDADTFEGIADAIVLAEYKAFGPMGSGGVSCHLGETTVSDKDGWFTLPLDPDPRSGMPILQAYHRGYMWAFSPRFPLCERFDRCRIGVGKWDTDRHMVSYYSESEIFPNHEAAEKASRYWIDPYLKRVDMVPSERLEELHSEGNSRNVHVFRHLYSWSALVS